MIRLIKADVLAVVLVIILKISFQQSSSTTRTLPFHRDDNVCVRGGVTTIYCKTGYANHNALLPSKVGFKRHYKFQEMCFSA